MVQTSKQQILVFVLTESELMRSTPLSCLPMCSKATARLVSLEDLIVSISFDLICTKTEVAKTCCGFYESRNYLLNGNSHFLELFCHCEYFTVVKFSYLKSVCRAIWIWIYFLILLLFYIIIIIFIIIISVVIVVIIIIIIIITAAVAVVIVIVIVTS